MRFQSVYTKRYYQISEEGNQLLKSKVAKSNLSKTKTASLVGISDSYLDHLLRNDRNFREDELQKIVPFLNTKLDSKYFIPKNTIHGKFITLPRKSSPKLMQIIGYLLGDGTVQPRSIRFKDADREVLQVYQKLIMEVFAVRGRVVPIKGTIAYLLEVNSLYLSKWLERNITCRIKDFLEEMTWLPKKQLAAFLRGLFDAEGCVAVQSRQIKLSITNKEIAKGIHIFLSKLKIPASFYRIKRREANWSDVYTNCLNSYTSFEKFTKIIGLSSQEKLNKLSVLMFSYKRKFQKNK